MNTLSPANLTISVEASCITVGWDTNLNPVPGTNRIVFYEKDLYYFNSAVMI